METVKPIYCKREGTCLCAEENQHFVKEEQRKTCVFHEQQAEKPAEPAADQGDQAGEGATN